MIGFPSSPCNQLLVRQTKGDGDERERAEVVSGELVVMETKMGFSEMLCAHKLEVGGCGAGFSE